MGWRQTGQPVLVGTQQTLMDVADLEIKFRQVRVPSSVTRYTFVHIHRSFVRAIGYVAVQLDRSLQQGTLLGH